MPFNGLISRAPLFPSKPSSLRTFFCHHFSVINLMSYEVELKFPVPDLPAFAQKLTDLAIPISPAQEEIDVYFAHPARDFAKTDEALRLRRKGAANYITYK